jgi:anti-sigma factor RsiW
MIACYRFRELISNYIDQDINFNQRREFEEHLDSCPGCAELYNSVLSTQKALRNFTTLSVSEDFMARLQARIKADRNHHYQAAHQKGFKFTRIPSFAYGFAAALVTVVAGFMILNRQHYEPTVSPAPAIVNEQLQKPRSDMKSQFAPAPTNADMARLAAKELEKAEDDSSQKPTERDPALQQDLENRIKAVNEKR